MSTKTHWLAWHRVACALAGLCLATIACAREQDVDPWDGEWHTQVSVYAWIPGMSADTRFRLPDSSIVENRTDGNIYSNLSGAFMFETTVRKGRWGFYGDADWVKFDDQNSHIASIGGQRIGASAKLKTRWNAKGGMVTLAGTYTLGHSRQGYIDVMLGVRYLWLKGNTAWDFAATGNGGRTDIADSGRDSRQVHVTSAIIGVRGRWTPFPSEAVFIPYYFDIGTGTVDRTHQYAAGIGYQFHWGDLALTYRDVEYHQHGNSAFLHAIRVSGPSLNLTWAF